VLAEARRGGATVRRRGKRRYCRSMKATWEAFEAALQPVLSDLERAHQESSELSVRTTARTCRPSS
jgi:hypothetical protein